MFGRYELPLWRKILGIILIGVFVYNLYGYCGSIW